MKKNIKKKKPNHIKKKKILTEFEKKIQKNENALKFIDLIVSADSKKMLIGGISVVQKALKASAQDMIDGQAVFSNSKAKESLLAASDSKVKQIKAELQSSKAAVNMKPEQKEQAFAMLDELGRIKRQSAYLSSVLNALNEPVPQISAYNLLAVMFNLVMIHMYPDAF